MATLVKHRTGIYYAQFFDKRRCPQSKRFSLKTRNRRTAERILTKLESDHLLGTFDPWDARIATGEENPAGALASVGIAVDAYMASCGHLSPHTLRTYRSIFELFREHLGAHCEVGCIRPKDVVAFLDSTNANPVTRKKYLHHLGYFFRFLLRHGMLDRDLSKEVKLPRLPEQAPKSMTPSDVERLLQAIGDHSARSRSDGRLSDFGWLADIVQANVYLGLRLGEVIHLRWEHVDLETRTLAVRNTEEFTTKRGKERVLPIPRAAFEVLCCRSERRNGEPWVFTYHRGRLKRHYLSQAFLKFRRKSGLSDDITFHSTRHTFATWLAERGVPVGVIKELMGHSSITTTERYMRVRPATTRHWVEQAFS